MTARAKVNGSGLRAQGSGSRPFRAFRAQGVQGSGFRHAGSDVEINKLTTKVASC